MSDFNRITVESRTGSAEVMATEESIFGCRAQESDHIRSTDLIEAREHRGSKKFQAGERD